MRNELLKNNPNIAANRKEGDFESERGFHAERTHRAPTDKRFEEDEDPHDPNGCGEIDGPLGRAAEKPEHAEQKADALDEGAEHETGVFPTRIDVAGDGHSCRLGSQNCAVLGARGNGMTSRMFAMPVA